MPKRTDHREIGQYPNRQERSLKDIMTAPPMSEAEHKARAAQRRDARRSIEDRALEKELNQR